MSDQVSLSAAANFNVEHFGAKQKVLLAFKSILAGTVKKSFLLSLLLIEKFTRELKLFQGAGMTGKILEYPLDTVKVRLQTSSGTSYKGPIDCIKQIFRTEGVKAFYRVKKKYKIFFTN